MITLCSCRFHISTSALKRVNSIIVWLLPAYIELARSEKFPWKLRVEMEHHENSIFHFNFPPARLLRDQYVIWDLRDLCKICSRQMWFEVFFCFFFALLSTHPHIQRERWQWYLVDLLAVHRSSSSSASPVHFLNDNSSAAAEEKKTCAELSYICITPPLTS